MRTLDRSCRCVHEPAVWGTAQAVMVMASVIARYRRVRETGPLVATDADPQVVSSLFWIGAPGSARLAPRSRPNHERRRSAMFELRHRVGLAGSIESRRATQCSRGSEG